MNPTDWCTNLKIYSKTTKPITLRHVKSFHIFHCKCHNILKLTSNTCTCWSFVLMLQTFPIFFTALSCFQYLLALQRNMKVHLTSPINSWIPRNWLWRCTSQTEYHSILERKVLAPFVFAKSLLTSDIRAVCYG